MRQTQVLLARKVPGTQLSISYVAPYTPGPSQKTNTKNKIETICPYLLSQARYLSLYTWVCMKKPSFNFLGFDFVLLEICSSNTNRQNLRICSFTSTCMASTSVWWRPGTECSSRIRVGSTSMELATGGTRLGIVPPKCLQLYRKTWWSMFFCFGDL